MPTLNLMVWNIQNFGDAVPAKGNYAPLCNFVAYVAQQQAIDVLVVQELRNAGVQYLDQLRTSLNAVAGGNWQCDYVYGALAVDPSVTLPTTAAHTRMDMDHNEGYALFWNHARSADFTLAAAPENISGGTRSVLPLPAGVPAHAVTLVYRGRDTSGGINHNGWFNAPAFTPGAPNADSFLNFCRSAAMIHIGDQLAIGPRRPCSFTINLDPANAHNSDARYCLPICVYHATANQRNTATNVQLSGYSRQLYQVYGAGGAWVGAENAVIAGDFNIDANTNDTNRDVYTIYTETYANGGAAAASPYLNYTTYAAPRTTVQLKSLHHHTPIVGNVPAAFLRLSIDHFFYRIAPLAVANLAGGVVDLFGLVMNTAPPRLLRQIISDFWTPIDNALGAQQENGAYANYPLATVGSGTPYYTTPSVNGPVSHPVIGDLANWDNFQTGILGGSFHRVNLADTNDDARTAAEFINKLVSDHLPTVFRFDY